MPTRRSYWIDTDPGADDALAVLLAIREIQNDLAGISTAQGMSVGKTAWEMC
jgi:inosine-uridine nucleoside N-ribohydrolase